MKVIGGVPRLAIPFGIVIGMFVVGLYVFNREALRIAWEEIRFRDLPESEDQASGRDLLERGWAKVFHPGAGVLHAHDYGLMGFMRRYFDEYRGLRESIGHVEPFGMRAAVRDVDRLVGADRSWMGERGWSPRRRAAWTARAVAHHAGRKTFAAPEFYATSYATSNESHWAAMSYQRDLFGIRGSPWLQTLMQERYGLESSFFEYGVDEDVYHPRPVDRRRDTVVFCSRMVTPRRATLGVQALGELRGGGPTCASCTSATPTSPGRSTPTRVGIASPEQLSWLFSEATVGLCFSMTNLSLIPKEMMACGLPVVELDRPSARSIFGDPRPIELSEFDPDAVADHLKWLLGDRALWEQRSREGLAWVEDATWDRAAEQVDAGIRHPPRPRARLSAGGVCGAGRLAGVLAR